jgi:hypothetical protein
VKAISREQRNDENSKILANVKTDVWYRFNMYSMSLLVNARTLHEFLQLLEDISICLLSKIKTNMLLDAYRRTQTRIQNMDEDKDIDLSKFETKPNDVEQENDELPCSKMHSNPFTALFKNKLLFIEQTVEQDQMEYNDDLNQRNRCYCPKFMDFIKSYIPEMALWSGVMLGSLQRYSGNSEANPKKLVTGHPYLSFSSANSKTEGYIEGVMRNLKQEDFHARKHLRPDAFVLENYDRIRRRIVDYSDRLDACRLPKQKRSYRQKKKENDNPNLVTNKDDISQLQEQYRNAEEKWGKKEPETPKLNPRLGQFQQSPKFPLSEQPDLKDKSRGKKKINDDKEKSRTVRRKRKLIVNDKRQGKRDAEQTNTTKTSIEITEAKEESKPNKFLAEEAGQKKRKGRKRRLNNARCRKNITEWMYIQANDKEEAQGGEEDNCVKTAGSKRERLKSSENEPKKKKFARFENNRILKSDISFVGLQNKKNDCWLNTLVQCIYNLPIKNCLLDATKGQNDKPLTKALTNVLSKMESLGSGSFYPAELHDVFQFELNYVNGDFFTTFCCTSNN